MTQDYMHFTNKLSAAFDYTQELWGESPPYHPLALPLDCTFHSRMLFSLWRFRPLLRPMMLLARRRRR